VLLATDVHYSDTGATAAGVAFDAWSASTASQCWVLPFTDPPAPYQSGRFYLRELPYLREVVSRASSDVDVDTIIVDGHVWLTDNEPGLGMHLYESLAQTVPVVGIAKSAYHDGAAIPVRRGRSRRPLFVSSVGLDRVDIAVLVAHMHGEGRIPTIVRIVDRLARQGDTRVVGHPGTTSGR
jgi:deoxyribonuclease V